MKKIIVIVCVLLVATMLLSGCTGEKNDDNTINEFKVSNQAEASQTLNDVSTNLSGISNSFDEINENLTD
jgi:outer membrane lipoprotein-sorting protein